jgi:hypothetical protein
MIIYRNGKSLLGLILTDYILIERSLEFGRVGT